MLRLRKAKKIHLSLPRAKYYKPFFFVDLEDLAPCGGEIGMAFPMPISFTLEITRFLVAQGVEALLVCWMIDTTLRSSTFKYWEVVVAINFSATVTANN